jgi:hypothetical protein
VPDRLTVQGVTVRVVMHPDYGPASAQDALNELLGQALDVVDWAYADPPYTALTIPGRLRGGVVQGYKEGDFLKAEKAERDA